jgi:hypothetical protein
MRAWVLAYLDDAVDQRRDPTERRWVYTALGEIGGDEAERVLQRGLSDTSAFARRGAEKAAERLKRS